MAFLTVIHVPFWRPAMRKQLTIIAAGLGLAVGGFGLFSVSASAMSASGVAAISEVNHVPDPVGLPVERVQYYPYGYPCVFPFCGYGYYGPGYYGRGYIMGAGTAVAAITGAGSLVAVIMGAG
jgi:hypothetical protein